LNQIPQMQFQLDMLQSDAILSRPPKQQLPQEHIQ
jgi:hypothetical protein